MAQQSQYEDIDLSAAQQRAAFEDVPLPTGKTDRLRRFAEDRGKDPTRLVRAAEAQDAEQVRTAPGQAAALAGFLAPAGALAQIGASGLGGYVGARARGDTVNESLMEGGMNAAPGAAIETLGAGWRVGSKIAKKTGLSSLISGLKPVYATVRDRAAITGNNLLNEVERIGQFMVDKDLKTMAPATALKQARGRELGHMAIDETERGVTANVDEGIRDALTKPPPARDPLDPIAPESVLQRIERLSFPEQARGAAQSRIKELFRDSPFSENAPPRIGPLNYIHTPRPPRPPQKLLPERTASSAEPFVGTEAGTLPPNWRGPVEPFDAAMTGPPRPQSVTLQELDLPLQKIEAPGPTDPASALVPRDLLDVAEAPVEQLRLPLQAPRTPARPTTSARSVPLDDLPGVPRRIEDVEPESFFTARQAAEAAPPGSAPMQVGPGQRPPLPETPSFPSIAPKLATTHPGRVAQSLENPVSEPGKRQLKSEMNLVDLLRTIRERSFFGKPATQADEAITRVNKAVELGGRNAFKKAIPGSAQKLEEQGLAMDAESLLDRAMWREANRDQASSWQAASALGGVVSGSWLAGAVPAVIGFARNRQIPLGIRTAQLGQWMERTAMSPEQAKQIAMSIRLALEASKGDPAEGSPEPQ